MPVFGFESRLFDVLWADVNLMKARLEVDLREDSGFPEPIEHLFGSRDGLFVRCGDPI